MSMKEDAILKALDGVIPYEEVNTFGTKVGSEAAIGKDFLPDDTTLPVQPGEQSVPPETKDVTNDIKLNEPD